jgi:hypothetical protein
MTASPINATAAKANTDGTSQRATPILLDSEISSLRPGRKSTLRNCGVKERRGRC